MSQAMRIFLLLSLAIQTFLVADGKEDYLRLYDDFTKGDHRIQGSPELESAQTSVEAYLKSAGLEVNRQTYDSLAPDTVCSLTVNGKAISGVHALGPNGFANNSAGPESIEGSLVWLNDGSLAEMRGKQVRGSIALLRFDSMHIDLVFSQGAKAVVFVGDGTESQWDLRQQFTELPFSVPRVFISRADAMRQGLLGENKKELSGKLNLVSTWKDVIASNLWTMIPGQGESEEVVVLAATLSTFGSVPTLAPGNRQAANAALLAVVAKELSTKELKRDVIVVFFGSNYAAQDGSRHFYYAIHKAKDKPESNDSLGGREKGYASSLEMIEEQVKLLRGDLINSEHPLKSRTVDLLKQKLNAWVATANYEIQMETEKAKGKSAKLDKSVIADLQDVIAKIQAKKKIWNGLRSQIKEGEITDTENFGSLVDLIAKELQDGRQDFLGRIAHNKTFQTLAEKVKTKRVVSHFGFDFANGVSPWLLNPIGSPETPYYHSLRAEKLPTLGAQQSHIQRVSSIAKDLEGTNAFDGFLEGLIYPDAFCMPDRRSTAAAIPNSIKIPGYQMISLGDELALDETPYEQKVDLSGLLVPITQLSHQFTHHDAVGKRVPLKKYGKSKKVTFFYQGGGIYGTQFLSYALGGGELEGPSQNSIAGATNNKIDSFVLPGHTRAALTRINRFGYVFIPLMYSNTPLQNYGYDEHGLFNRVPIHPWKGYRSFYANGGGTFLPLLPEGYKQFSGKVLNGQTDSNFQKSFVRSNEEMLIFYKDRLKNIKLIDGILVLGSTEEKVEGYGTPALASDLLTLNAVGQSALDYIALNEKRLGILREKEIINDSLETLHSDAVDHLEQAVASRSELKHDEAFAHEAFAMTLGARVSKPLKDITKDMVDAVIFLLILTVPFSFVMERLFFNTISIYRQVAGFSLFFLLTFFTLFVVHPAFSLASSPIVIFLAFFIILISAVCIYVMVGKFKIEIKAMQGMGSTVHGAKSDSSTAMAAVLIGISGMRNRPLKTTLTAITVVILTFTILVFASFSSKLGVQTTYVGKSNGESRIELHRFSFLNIPTALTQSFEALYSKDWHVLTRESAFRKPQYAPHPPAHVVLNEGNEKWVKLDGMMSFDPKEFELNPELASIVPNFPASSVNDEVPPLFLSKPMADSLEVKIGQPLKVRGQSFVFGGTLESAALGGLSNLDGSKLTPPDFKTTTMETTGNESSEVGNEGELDAGEDVDVTNFIYYPAQTVGLTVNGALRNIDGVTSFVSLYPKETAHFEETSRELANVFHGPVLSNSSEGVSQYFFTSSTESSGMSEVIVPLLLGGLIIFSSLLGSITDRSKEIFTYSALGLSPPDVGALFFAESSVYAIIGGVGGYLLSQVCAALLSLGGEYGLFHPPDMNFSSFASAMTILVVMVTVMLSTIYPALQAGKAANPGVSRKWKMPSPEGNKISFVFPFTVSERDMIGILGFIREYFGNHSDSSLGSFAASDVALFKENQERGENYGIRARISLAPFDLGVSQVFTLRSRPSEIEGIDEVLVDLERLSGTEGAWLRGNRQFISDLRNQFLFWRNLPVETVEHFRSESNRHLQLAMGEV